MGWIILFFINPLTSTFVQYYEKTKSNYARDIDHLVTFNKNGLWIKENYNNGERIITATQPDKYEINNVVIFELNNNFNFDRKIFSRSAFIKNKEWVLSEVKIIFLKGV